MEQFRKIQQSQDWFEVYEVIPGLFAIYEPGHWERVISYLITGSEKALLFDSGMGIGDIKQVCRELTSLDIILLASHSHYDHIGGHHSFDTIWGSDNQFARKVSKGLSKEKVTQLIPSESITKQTPKGFNRLEYEIKPYSISHFVQEGEVINLGGLLLEVIFTPGHSPDCICLFDGKNRHLFTGDTFYLGSLYAHLPESDINSYYQSALRLANLQKSIDWLFPSHSPPIKDSQWLIPLRDAFREIVDDALPFKEKTTIFGPVRNYFFDRFSILTPMKRV